jgi:hypothetical protein
VTQTLYPIDEAMKMTKEMCKRVGIANRAGNFIISMVRLRRPQPGMLVDMAVVAQGIKYAGDNKEFLKPQFTLAPWAPTEHIPKPDDAGGRFTFLK